MPSDIVQRLEASIRFDAINGDAHERNVCKRQMAEAIAELNRLKRHISTTDAALQESVQLQSHYAKLLNQYDGGVRDRILGASKMHEHCESLTHDWDDMDWETGVDQAAFRQMLHEHAALEQTGMTKDEQHNI